MFLLTRPLPLLLVVNLATSFVLKPLVVHKNNEATSSTARFVVDQGFPMLDSLSIEEMKSARAAFALCFFGAAGSASLGREVIPKTWNQWQRTRAIMGSGKGSGGEELGVFGYPEPVYVNDVLSVLNNNMTATEIEETYPGMYQGYLQFESMVEANADVSPMAVRAVFDSLSLGINKNQIRPAKAERILEMYRNDLEEMKKNLQLGKALGVSAFVILLGLLGVADYFALYHLLRGWFPDWQGLSELPSSLFDDRGFSNLMNCFINDIPDM